MSAVAVEPSPDGVPGAVTDPSSLAAEELTFPGAEGTPINGYLCRPDRPGRRPAMLVIQEAGGVNDHIRDVTNRLANLGYVALAVDLYTREGGPAAGDMTAILQRLFEMPDARILGDLEGAAAALHAREDVDGRLGCIGFCVGGRTTLLFACASDRLDVAVDCWGGFADKATLEQVRTPERPTPPLELAPQLSCPLMAAVGAEDQNPSPAFAAQLLERATQSGHTVQVGVYPEAGHAFFADYRPTYRPRAAHELWTAIVPFLALHLARS